VYLTLTLLRYESQLFEVEFLRSAFQFYAFTSAWCLHMLDPSRRGHPIPPPSSDWTILPEFIIDDMIDLYLFLIRCVGRMSDQKDDHSVRDTRVTESSRTRSIWEWSKR
jgi:hypothetical protein